MIVLQKDTIAALSTALGESAIAVVRLSGPESRELADRLFRGALSLAETEPRLMRYGRLVDERGEPFDEVLAVWFAAPKSYTAEEMAEIHCHGGNMAARLCLERLYALGARPALPGEFTQRAFLNGRIDLAQAEGVLATIQARTEAGLKAAQKSLSGHLSRRVQALHSRLIDLEALIEAGLDYPDEEIPPLTEESLLTELKVLQQEAAAIVETCRVGLLLRQGIGIALVGKPNVGKSSLLNALLSRSRAIVTAVAGTTRDVIEETLSHRGVPLRLLDTAGLRNPRDEVEALGIDRTLEALGEADLALLVLDGSVPLTKEDREAAARLEKRPHLTILNKADLEGRVSEKEARALSPAAKRVLSLSAKKGAGIEKLKEVIVGTVVASGLLDEGLNSSAAQLDNLRRSLEALEEAQRISASSLGLDVVASTLAEGRLFLERVLGLSGEDLLLERLFSRFCVGK